MRLSRVLTVVVILATPPVLSAQSVSTDQQELLALVKRMADPNELSARETERMRALLSKPDVSQAVGLDLALAAIKTHLVRGDFQSEIVGLVFRRWQTDPRVIAFYRDALATHGPAAIGDLTLFATTPFDTSLIEPVIALIGGVAPEMRNSVVVGRGLRYMDSHVDAWSRDESVARRLSQVVRRFQPTSVANGMYVWTDWVAQTHDREMIAVLRPLLDDQTIDDFSSRSSNMPSGVTPMRYSELAANAICRLLGEAILFDPWTRVRAVTLSDGRYAEWTEWDRKIAALKQRIDKRERRPYGWTAPVNQLRNSIALAGSIHAS